MAPPNPAVAPVVNQNARSGTSPAPSRSAGQPSSLRPRRRRAALAVPLAKATPLITGLAMAM